MMAIKNIKIWICIACLACSMAAPAPNPQPELYLDIIDMAAISRMSPQQLETLAGGLAAEEIMRTKRSSVQSLTSAVVAKASSGLQSKLGLLGQASALASSASSKTNEEHHGYSYEPHDEKYDYWGLKKSILYTLFQAVKAITGGVTILKGQLIKGGGALAATLGKVISVKGDAVSNLGKKIVSSAALSNKKPAAPVYGPPPTHIEYGPPPSAYGAPTAPAHYSAPALTTGYGGHKYPAHLDGRGPLNGLQAGIVLLAPLGAPQEPLETAHTGHTPLEPPKSLLHTVYSAIKNVFSTADSHAADLATNQPPPPPPPLPSGPAYQQTWGALNSYGEPAAADTYSDYDPRNVQPSYDYAASKHYTLPKQKGLTPEKLQKINQNLSKLNVYINQRSSDEEPVFTGVKNYVELLRKGQTPFLPTPVVTDNEIGVLPAELLPEPVIETKSTTTTKTTTETQTTTETTRRKDVKYILRGNRIVQV